MRILPSQSITRTAHCLATFTSKTGYLTDLTSCHDASAKQASEISGLQTGRPRATHLRVRREDRDEHRKPTLFDGGAPTSQIRE